MEQFNLNYHVIDRCNKNCIACGHYAPLAKPTDEGVSVEDFRKDLELCSFLKPYIKTFYLTGGEPTLHKNLKEIIEIAAQWHDNVVLITNGINIDLLRENAEFIKKNNILLSVTNYSQNRVQEIANIFGYIESMHIPNLDKDGNRVKFNTKQLSIKEVNPQVEYCDRGLCVQYRYGKLYMCQVAANLHLFKAHFGDAVSMFTDEGTYVDLNETQDLNVIENLLFKKFPKLCRHCNEAFYQHDLKDNSQPICASRQSLSEWVEDVQ